MRRFTAWRAATSSPASPGRRRASSTNSFRGTGKTTGCTIRLHRPRLPPGAPSRRSSTAQTQPEIPRGPRRMCVDAPFDASIFSVGWLHAVRCCRVSGLSLRHVTRRGPSWRCADRVHIAYASSKALYPQTGFPDPVSIDRLPLPFFRPARVPDSYPPGRLSGDGRSPVTLLLRHQRSSPIMGKPSPSRRPPLAKECRKSWMRTSLSPARARMRCHGC